MTMSALNATACQQPMKTSKQRRKLLLRVVVDHGCSTVNCEYYFEAMWRLRETTPEAVENPVTSSHASLLIHNYFDRKQHHRNHGSAKIFMGLGHQQVFLVPITEKV